MAYTHAYTFAVKNINPELPNNAGSLAPSKSSHSCIVNAKYVPVNARHVVGMYVPFPILNALSPVSAPRDPGRLDFPDTGRSATGDHFTSSTFNYSEVWGESCKDGLSATCYPTGVSAVPRFWRPLFLSNLRLKNSECPEVIMI